MPDSETLKLIINGGSFGLLAVIALWLLLRGAPMIQTTLAKQTEDHKETVAMIVKNADDAELRCAVERKEMWGLFLAESKLNREAREAQSRQCQGR